MLFRFRGEAGRSNIESCKAYYEEDKLSNSYDSDQHRKARIMLAISAETGSFDESTVRWLSYLNSVAPLYATEKRLIDELYDSMRLRLKRL